MIADLVRLIGRRGEETAARSGISFRTSVHFPCEATRQPRDFDSQSRRGQSLGRFSIPRHLGSYSLSNYYQTVNFHTPISSILLPSTRTKAMCRGEQWCPHPTTSSSPLGQLGGECHAFRLRSTDFWFLPSAEGRACTLLLAQHRAHLSTISPAQTVTSCSASPTTIPFFSNPSRQTTRPAPSPRVFLALALPLRTGLSSHVS